MDNTSPHGRRRCQDSLRQINEYIDGDLADDLCEELENHMQNCPDCRIVVDTLSKTVKLYRSLAQTSIDLPPDVESRLLSRLKLVHQ
jgi:anti-sigma factor (TIGR02949 family)